MLNSSEVNTDINRPTYLYSISISIKDLISLNTVRQMQYAKVPRCHFAVCKPACLCSYSDLQSFASKTKRPIHWATDAARTAVPYDSWQMMQIWWEVVCPNVCVLHAYFVRAAAVCTEKVKSTSFGMQPWKKHHHVFKTPMGICCLIDLISHWIMDLLCAYNHHFEKN